MSAILQKIISSSDLLPKTLILHASLGELRLL